MLAEILSSQISKTLAGRTDVALGFSGGTDSTVLLFTLLRLGIKPVLYTYHLDGVYTDDLKKAETAATWANLKLVRCPIPQDIDQLVVDVRAMIWQGIRGKVAIQCMHGHIYTAPYVKQAVIFNGSGVDALYGVYRDFAFAGARDDKAIFDRMRRVHLDKPNDDAMIYQAKCYQAYGAEVAYPYRCPAYVDALMGMNWREINTPRFKWVVVKEYPEFEQMPHYYRPRGSQQIMAGTRAYHQELLHTPFNLGHKRVDEIYKDIASGRV